MDSKQVPFETIVPNVLTICTYTEFAPFSYEERDKIVGTDIALLEAFATAMSMSVDIIRTDFDGLWDRPGYGECDIAAAGIAALRDRDISYTGVWSIPYIEVMRSLLIRRTDANTLKEPHDFVGKKIVVTPSSTAHFDAQARYEPLGATVLSTVPSQSEVVRQILSHEVDAFGEGDVSNGYLLEKHTDQDGYHLLALTDIHPTDPRETLHFAVRASDKRLVTELNEFIAAEQAYRLPLSKQF